MTASDFHGKPVVPDSVEHQDADVLLEVLSRHAINVSEAAAELGVGSADLRRLLWARPQLTDAAVEVERSGGSIWRRRTFTKPFAATIRGGAMRLRCSPFATAIGLAGAAGSPRRRVWPSFPSAPAPTVREQLRIDGARRKTTRATPRRPGASGCAMRGSRWSVLDGVTAGATRLSNMNLIRGLRARIEILKRQRVLGLL